MQSICTKHDYSFTALITALETRSPPGFMLFRLNLADFYHPRSCKGLSLLLMHLFKAPVGKF